MADKFPKRRQTDVTAEIGVNLVSTIINDRFGWIFRKVHEEHDFGVDAYVDYVTDEGNVTGQSIAMQIKTGVSYLSGSGKMHWYTDSAEHLNYFLNLPSPILLVICDPKSSECFWACLDKNKVDFREKNWRHPVPKSQKLSKKEMQKIAQLFGETINHLSEFEYDRKLLKMISDNSFLLYSVPKEDIEKRDVSNLQSFLSRITRNEKLTLAVQGKLCISTYGYESDKREIYQIKEVKRWAKKARNRICDWYLCTNVEPRLSSLIWIVTSTCRTTSQLKEKPDGTMGYLIKYQSSELARFVEECSEGLNMASEKWGWSDKYVYEISKKIHHELFPDVPYPEYDSGD